MFIYCRANHVLADKNRFYPDKLSEDFPLKKEVYLCRKCAELLGYGITQRRKCRYNPKPMCKKCETQCYTPEYRAEIRKVMRFSGIWFIRHFRLDLLYHYYF